MLIVLKLVAMTAVVNKLPVGKVGCIYDHVIAKSDLGRSGSEGGVVSCLEAKGCGLENVMNFIGEWKVGLGIEVLSVDAANDGEVNPFADGIG
eukprot:14677297-Ditylum_brightwellii.AAC.1